MLARIRKSTQEKDQGFTLIELLVVMIIIGILASIAIPVFLSQRKKAVDSSIRSDLRSVANEAETFFVDNQTYVGFTLPATVRLSKNNVVTPSGLTATGFCLTGTNPNANANDATTKAFWYDSAKGGLQSGAPGAKPTGGSC